MSREYAIPGGYVSDAEDRDFMVPVGYLAHIPAVTPPTTGLAKVWGGSAWAQKPVKVWSGSAWVTKPAKVWNGSAWVTVGTAPPAAPTSSLITSFTPGSDRNDFTGEVGVRLGVGTTGIPFTWMGARRHSAAQTGVHTLNLYEWFADTLVRTASIDYTGVAVGSYAWVSVPSTTLLANGYYALLMPVTAFDGQTWCNPGVITFQSSIVNVYDCYRVPASALATGTPNDAFIGLDLGW
jgi:hypothetical protein